ncbi:MAG: hypothetical protein E7566_05650 [Ruminococcaceae bacterium]|nr:hypothetical protein [Oscillospiraceae bacterium]
MKFKRLLAILLAVIMLAGTFVVSGLSVSAASYSTVKKGSKGSDVKTLQTMLNKVDNAGLTVDGIFGSGTEKAVKNFQKDQKLTVDGIVGKNTWAALEKAYNSSKSSLKIGSGNYDPVSLIQGKSYSIKGKITSDYKITSVTVGVYKTNGTATAQVKTVKPNAKSYNISSVDKYIKFGSLAAGTYNFVVKATDASGTTKTLVSNKFKVTEDIVKAFEARALDTWVAPLKQTNFYKVKSAPRYFGARRDSGNRAHAGIDFHFKNGKGVPVYAMQAGKVVEYSSNFYGGMQAIAVQHADGTIARYCEISTNLRKGATVKQGQQIATIAKSNIGGDTMLHLELYMGTASGKLSNASNKSTYDYVSGSKYNRRRDLLNPEFLLDLF